MEKVPERERDHMDWKDWFRTHLIQVAGTIFEIHKVGAFQMKTSMTGGQKA